MVQISSKTSWTELLEKLTAEFTSSMYMVGARKIGDLNPDMVRIGSGGI